MSIKVLLFGQLSEITKTSELHYSELNTTQELSLALAEQFPNLVEVNYSMAVNKKLIVGETLLHDQDIVALLPPFSGG